MRLRQSVKTNSSVNRVSMEGKYPSEWSVNWQRLLAEVDRFEGTCRGLRVSSEVIPQDLRNELAQQFAFRDGMGSAEVIDRVESLLQKFNTHVTHPRYFGLFNPSVRPICVAADAMAALYNPQLATWSHAPAACELERFTLRALAERIGLELESLVCNFTSGGAEANLSATLVAMAHRFPDSCEMGIGSVRPRIYLTSESHHSFVKIAKMTGMGRQAIQEVPVDGALKMDVHALEQMVHQDRAAGLSPMMVIGTAGTTAAGVVDALPALASVCKEQQLWFHVDAAWGGSAGLSPRLKHVLDGIAAADSVTWDAHKWLFVPMGAGMFFCRHREAVQRAFATQASYMPSQVSCEAEDPYQMTTQWSRRMIGLKVFMAIAELGWEKLAALIDHQTAMGDALRVKLEQSGWIIKNQSELPVVCFTHPKIQRGERTTQQILQMIYARGSVWISDVTLGGKERVLRACITSYATESEDLDCLIDEIEAALVG